MQLSKLGVWTTYHHIGEQNAGEAARLVERLGYGTFWLGGSPRLSAVRPLLEATEHLVVATGTGSGKTECFLLPVLDDVLRNPHSGVRAILIYPMNALANSQAGELEKFRSTITRGNCLYRQSSDADRCADSPRETPQRDHRF